MTKKRPSPWVWVLINQLAFPGLGTILAGSRLAGYAQAILMVAGFILTTGFLLYYLLCMVRLITSSWSEAQFAAHYRPYLWSLYWGLGLSAFAWFWALYSSLRILRSSGR
jgi:hypothetical protein